MDRPCDTGFVFTSVFSEFTVCSVRAVNNRPYKVNGKINTDSHDPRLSRGLDLALEGHFTDDCP